MAESKKIYCPRCNRYVGTSDGRSSINFIARCNHCRRRIVYNIETGEIVVKPLPPRETSSGKTFI